MAITSKNGVALSGLSNINGVSSISAINGQSATIGGSPSSLLTDLVAYWKLDEASGTRDDAVGSNNLTDNNTVTQNTGKVGSAAEFNASNSEFLSCASSAALQTGNVDFTIACWVYITANGVNQRILGKYDDASNSGEYALTVKSSDLVEFVITGSGGSTTVFTSGTLSTNTWYFVVAYLDSVNSLIGIHLNNGAADTQATGGNYPFTSAALFEIGAIEYSGAEQYFTGRIDEVGLWKRLLTAPEKAELYNSGSGITHPF